MCGLWLHDARAAEHDNGPGNTQLLQGNFRLQEVELKACASRCRSNQKVSIPDRGPVRRAVENRRKLACALRIFLSGFGSLPRQRLGAPLRMCRLRYVSGIRHIVQLQNLPSMPPGCAAGSPGRCMAHNDTSIASGVLSGMAAMPMASDTTSAARRCASNRRQVLRRATAPPQLSAFASGCAPHRRRRQRCSCRRVAPRAAARRVQRAR